MEKALQRFLRYQRAAGNSPKTVSYHEQTMGLFMRWAKEQGYPIDIENLDADMVREWADEQRERGLSPATVATRVRGIKVFTSWLASEEYLDRDPLRKLKIPKTGDIPKETLGPSEVDKLLATCDRRTVTGTRDTAIMLLLFSVGLRASELLALQTTDVDFDKGLIIVRRGKGGKVRVVPMGAKVERAIVRYLNHPKRPQQPTLFLNDEGDILTVVGLRQMLRRRGAKVGIHANPHKWRHSAAIQYLRSGGRVETLRTMLGHSTLDMTLHYARIAGVDLTTAHEVADPTKALKHK